MLNGNLLADLYDSTQPLLALKYYKIAAAAKDSLYGVNNTQTIQNLVQRRSETKRIGRCKSSISQKLKLYGLLTGLAALLIIAFILYETTAKTKSECYASTTKTKSRKYFKRIKIYTSTTNPK